MNKFSKQLTILMLALALLLAACGGQAAPTPTPVPEPTEEMEEPMADPTAVPTTEPMGEPEEEMEEPMDEAMSDEPSAELMALEPLMLDGSAAGLRVVLNRLLGEHVLLAASATNAALDGRIADFEAAAESLDVNSQSLAAAIGAVYGSDAQEAFLELWRTHIGFFVDYTTAVAEGNEDARQQALSDLDGYAADFAAFISGANPNIEADAVESLLGEHVATLTAVIDAQAAGEQEAVYSNLRQAYGHMGMHAQALATGIAAQFPEQFTGEAATPAAGLRVALNNLLAEHTFIAAMATNAALDGRTAEFEAAAAALDENTLDLGAAIGSVYGDDAEEAFVPLWREHIGFFVDYTNGVAMDDDAMKEQAIEDLLGYRADFIAFLTGANPNLTEEALTPILTPHVQTLTATIEGQGADTPRIAYAYLRDAYAHMQEIADPLAGAIVAQFPDMFSAMDDNMTADVTSATPAADLRVTLTNLLGEHTLLAASATNAALDGRTADFEMAAAALDQNTLDLGAAIGSVYGDDAEEAFVPLWRSHIGFFVDYTNGAAAGDDAVKEQAVQDLLGYRADFIAFLTGANPNLTEEALTEVLTPHVGTLTAVIDAQAAEDHEAAYEALREAYGHMQMIAGPLSGAISAQFPEQFAGAALSPAADLRTVLNVQLAEHTYLAAMATNAALEGRTAEFEAAAAALDENTLDLGAAIGSVYGDDAEEAFVPLWRSHIGFFVDYTNGVAMADEAMKEQAIEDLLGYRADFIAFLTGANPDLTEEALTAILTPHVGTLTTVIEAQGTADDSSEGYNELREAYGHMQMIADALAESIVQQFPENFTQ